MKTSAAALIFFSLCMPLAVEANPYLARPGEAPAAVRVAACAITGGFIHLYAALDYGLFDKYGVKVEFVSIRGSGVALAALAADEIQFLYCAADATIPGVAAGSDARLIGSPLVGLPWVLLARKDIRRPEDLKGKSIAVTRAGDLTFRLARALLKKFNLSESEVALRTVGGTGQVEPFNAMRAGIAEAALVTPPLDARGRRDGFNVVYRLNDLGVPAIYSSLHTNAKSLKERPAVIQKWVGALAESIHFVEKNPDKAKAAIARAMRVKDEEALQSSFNVYAKEIVDRTMIVPGKSISKAVEIARDTGTIVRKKPEELYDNSFVINLEKSGFIKELWGNENYRR